MVICGGLGGTYMIRDPCEPNTHPKGGENDYKRKALPCSVDPRNSSGAADTQDDGAHGKQDAEGDAHHKAMRPYDAASSHPLFR